MYSLVAHAACIAGLSGSLPQREETREVETLWHETLPRPEPEPAPVVEAESQPPAPVPVRPTPRRAQGRQSKAPQAATSAVDPGPPLIAAESGASEGTVEVRDAIVAAPGVNEHQVLPGQLSLWLAPLELQRMVIVSGPLIVRRNPCRGHHHSMRRSRLRARPNGVT